MVNSVPVWVLTAVIEVGLLGVGGLSVLLWLSGRSKRGLRTRIAALEEALEAQTTRALASEAVSLDEEEPLSAAPQHPSAVAPAVVAVGDYEPEVQKSLGTLRDTSAVMAQKIAGLQQKNHHLRQAVEAVQQNSALPKDQQQGIMVPEKQMQEIETELSSLQQTCQSLQRSSQELYALVEDKLGDKEAQNGEGNTADTEVQQIKAELEQRTADFQRIQEEYDALLSEYQRIYET